MNREEKYPGLPLRNKITERGDRLCQAKSSKDEIDLFASSSQLQTL